ncbi:hypothetical protein [Amycolatopsis sp.]|uniref:hypothetical protein n=1 Tax=Amycolatopsis sp. TaxID=37632 RepID=UPI002D8017EC|nr:hypothetical protein [Amycolatopsis sp.]HET6704312.1 hypothetical protein [Amycolatopsis sp.]
MLDAERALALVLGDYVEGVMIDGARVDGVGTFVTQAQTTGSVTISNVTATDVGSTGTYNCAYPSGSMQITGTGNTGWSSTWEGCDWP